MKRSELYELVWTKSVVKIARELGVSDVGLAKACRKHKIPIPPRGHWTKVEFGKPSPQTPLPPREKDESIELRGLEPHQKVRKEKRKVQAREIAAEVEKLDAKQYSIAPTLVKPHPLVKATSAYLARLPKIISKYERRDFSTWHLLKEVEYPPQEQNGRYFLSAPDGLIFTASLELTDWILRFFDGLFAALHLHKVSARRVVIENGNRSKESSIVLELDDERLSLSLSEGYRRYELDAEEFKVLQKKESWAKSWRYVPSGKLTFNVVGTEHSISKEWKGTPAQLEIGFTEIVATCLALFQKQPLARTGRLQNEENQRRAAQIAMEQRQVKEARSAQLANAFAAAKEFERVGKLGDFLLVLDKEILTWNEPYAARAKVWLAVVREELKERNPYLEMMQKCLSPDPWREWPPHWWPETKQ